MGELADRGLARAHVGRQPIYDAAGGLSAYELLFRDGPDAATASSSGDDATTATILAAFTDFGAEALLAGRRGFINLTSSFLTGRLPVPFPPHVAVLEVLETVEVDAALLTGVRELAERGFAVALDDFVWTTAAEPLLDVASIVKIDVLAQSWEDVRTLADRCRRYGVQLLAEGVETEEMLGQCRDAGFELFQGYYLGRPVTLSTATLTPSHANALRLLARLTDPAASAADVEELPAPGPRPDLPAAADRQRERERPAPPGVVGAGRGGDRRPGAAARLGRAADPHRRRPGAGDPHRDPGPCSRLRAARGTAGHGGSRRGVHRRPARRARRGLRAQRGGVHRAPATTRARRRRRAARPGAARRRSHRGARARGGGSADGRHDVAEAYLAALAWAGQMSLLVDESMHPRPKAPC